MSLNRLMLPTRLPHRCEIRTGDQAPTRGGRTRPNRLEHFRITGPRETCEAVAAVYGGEPRPWEGSPTPGAWEVYTQTDVLHVAVPINMPDVLDGPMWELWTGGGRVRRCDGQTCEATRVAGDGAVTETIPCQCNPDAPECKATTRLRVLITRIPGIGTDRLVTHSIHAAMEIPGVIDFLRLTGAQGLVPAHLRIRTKTVKRTGKQAKTFPVVTLEPLVEVADLLAGTAPAQITAPATRPALEAGDEVDVDGVWAQLRAEWPGTTEQLIDALRAEGITGRDMLAARDALTAAQAIVARGVTRTTSTDPDDHNQDREVEVHPDQESML